MKVLMTFVFLFAAMILPVKDALAISIAPVDVGSQIDAFDTALSYRANGQWYMYDYFISGSDAGFYGPAFAVFDLTSIITPVSNAVLRVQVTDAWTLLTEVTHLPVALYDITDIDRIYPPADWLSWSDVEFVDDYQEVKEDLISGAVYGEFLVPNYAEDIYYDVILTDAALFDMNASLGGLFAFSFGPGSTTTDTQFFASDHAYVAFGDVHLELAQVPEPCTILLLGAGFTAGLYLARKRGRKILR